MCAFDNNNPGTPLRTFPGQPGTAFTWFVDVPAPTSVDFLVQDANGEAAQTAAITVQPGSSDCLN
ncbi:hypothetical protein VNI00_008051 [Paramarasmius palmivorus]|uniref:Uncharacterized protein n=1 Tax=Paramarasmius palmivorus TaxID=297713 RepID=A0AAW0CZ24_9AGAR